jgi:hypothetical protein
MDRFNSSLSAPRQKLLHAMRQNPFCNIETVVRGGEPCFNPPPKIVREIKLGVDAPVRPSSEEAEFALKRAASDLFRHFDRLRDGSVVSIEVRHGQPARLILPGEL